jgi:hypothetical protein
LLTSTGEGGMNVPGKFRLIMEEERLRKKELVVVPREQPQPPSPRPRDAAVFSLMTDNVPAAPSPPAAVATTVIMEAAAVDKRPVESQPDRAKEKLVKPKEQNGGL